jgi:hypothetical protein
LSYSWRGDEKPQLTYITWTLEGAERGTKLRLEHSGFQAIGEFILSKLMMGPGWRRKMGEKILAVLAAIKNKEGK